MWWYLKMEMNIFPTQFSFQFIRTIILIVYIVLDRSYALDDSTNISPNTGFNDPQVISFDIHSPRPMYPTDGGAFGKGSIDLGGLEVYGASHFLKIWDTRSNGLDGLGATFYEPYGYPPEFKLLGHYCRPNGKPLLSSVLVAKDTTGAPNHGALKTPIDYTLIWTSKGLDFGQYDDGYIWLPIAPTGYKAVGHIVTKTPEKPSLDKVVCVRSDFTDSIVDDEWIWGFPASKSSRSVNVYTTKPVTEGPSVSVGTFIARVNGSQTHNLACLKTVRKCVNSTMPSPFMIDNLIAIYAPIVYFHPDEEYFPSTVVWFFQNGAELHENNSPIPQGVVDDGKNLPTTGTVDDSFLDLPPYEPQNDNVKRGFLQDAKAYVHVKPALGGTHTDLAIWLYYPFNGGCKFQLGPFAINLGKIGEHVSDWEHITLRIDNSNGVLKSIYLSQHNAGKWLAPEEFEFVNISRPVVYASWHGHAHYATASHHLHGKEYIDPRDIQKFNHLLAENPGLPIAEGGKFVGFGARDDTAKSGYVMDVASSYEVIAVDYESFDMKPWVNYTGRWGPKFEYELTTEIKKAISTLPWILRGIAREILHKLPPELLGEEGPEGPKMKDSWAGDERV